MWRRCWNGGVPAGGTTETCRLWNRYFPTVREWVKAAGSCDIGQTQRYLVPVAGLVVWAWRELRNTDPRVVLSPHNVEYWTMTVNAHRAATWREYSRGVLRIVGRAVNPEGWVPTRPVGRTRIAEPYTASRETKFANAAALIGSSNRTARMWMVCGALGAGLTGREIAAVRTDDLESIGDGRLVVRVTGRNPRLVPIRSNYTNLTHRTVEMTGTGRFVKASGKNAVSNTAARLDPGNGQGLVLRRARSTWLVAHLDAGTSLLVLRRIAGSLSMNTLDALMRNTTDTLERHRRGY